MTLYAVTQLSWSSICIRRTSCFCTDCFRDGIFNPVMMVGRQFFLPEATIMPTQTYNRVMHKQQCDVQTTEWCTNNRVMYKQQSDAQTTEWCINNRVMYKQQSDVQTTDWCTNNRVMYKQQSDVQTTEWCTNNRVMYKQQSDAQTGWPNKNVTHTFINKKNNYQAIS